MKKKGKKRDKLREKDNKSMLPDKAVGRITEREKIRIKKIINAKIVALQKHIEKEKKPYLILIGGG